MNSTTDAKTMKLEFFDPPMCCPTGICGPGVDEKLVQIQADIETLKAKYPNLVIERYMITQQPLKFRDNPAVYQLVKDQGKTVLPITTINGTIIRTGGYPSLAEIEQQLAGIQYGD
jgi:hypothetical protein